METFTPDPRPNINSGLDLNYTPDPRNFELGAAYALPVPEVLPEAYVLDPLDYYDQKDSDSCLACAFALASSLQEGIKLEPAFIFKQFKALLGDWRGYGANPEIGARAA